MAEKTTECSIPPCPKCNKVSCDCELDVGGLPPWFCPDCG